MQHNRGPPGRICGKVVLKFLTDLYWPGGAGEDPLVVAERRLLFAFLVIAGCGLMAVAVIYFQKNAQSYLLHAFGVFIVALAALLAPIWTSRTPSPRRAAVFILLVALAVNTILGSWIDGLVSVKSILFLPISMAAMLLFGTVAGLMVGLYAFLVMVGWHVFRDRIGGNLAIPLQIDDLSLLLLVGLSFAMVMLLAAAAIYRGQLLTIIGLAASARRQAELASNAKSLLLANVSHELRTPMSGITGLASSLLRTPLDDTQRVFADQIHHSGLVLERLLGDLLDYAALQSGGIDMRPDLFNAREAIERLARIFMSQADAKAVAFELRTDPSLDRVCVGDPVRIGQVVSNLLANAVKFTHHGRIEIEARIEEIDAGAGSCALIVRVADTGIGIPPDAQARIFDAFERVSADSGRRHGGVGLGLAISKALLDRMGGRITLDSAPGQGSTFTAHMPVLLSGEASVEGLPGPGGTLAGVRVLVIDDSPAHRMILGAMLDAFGAVPILAASGSEGMRHHAGGGVDVILVDLNLPDMDGIDVISRIGGLSEGTERKTAPILAISADGSGLREAEALRAGAHQLLSKPLSAATLHRGLAAALARD